MPEKLTRAETSRRNGALSHGPISAEGKAQSRRNSLKHGLSARKLLLTQAEQPLFERQLAIHCTFWAPLTLRELDVVSEAAQSSHRQDRAEAMLLDLVDAEIERAVALNEARCVDGTADAADFLKAYENVDRHINRIFHERLRMHSELQNGSAAWRAA